MKQGDEIMTLAKFESATYAAEEVHCIAGKYKNLLLFIFPNIK
jgi:hypothetical protein